MGKRRSKAKQTFSDRKGTFDPNDESHVKHTKVGIWDLYEERNPTLARIPFSARLERYLAASKDLPFLWRMLRDIGSMSSCWFLLICYALVEFLSAFIPAAKLYFTGQLLNVVSTQRTSKHFPC